MKRISQNRNSMLQSHRKQAGFLLWMALFALHKPAAMADTYCYLTVHNLGCRQSNHTYSGGILPYGFEEGDLVQLILAGPNRVIDPPAASGMPGGDDQLAMNPGASFGMNMDSFTHYPNTFYSPEAILVHTTGMGPQPAIASGVKFYVRAWNAANPSQATQYFDSDRMTRDFPVGLETCSIDSSVRTFPNLIQIPTLTSYYVLLDFGHPWTPTFSVQVTAPNGGEIYTVGDPVSITWSSIGSIAGVDVLLQRSTGGPWEILFQDIANDGAETWTSIGPAASQCRVRVQSSADTIVFDQSDADFTIANPPLPTIDLIQPDGGESVEIGDPLPIQWSTTGTTSLVDILVRRSLGGPWEMLFENSQNDGQEIWTATGPSSNQYRLRVQLSDDTTIFDQSSSNFSVTDPPPPPSLTMTSPSGQDTFALGDTLEIRWNSVGDIGTLRLLLTRNLLPEETLFVSMPNDSEENWLATIPAADDAMFRLESESNPAVYSVVNPVVLVDTTYSGPPAEPLIVIHGDSLGMLTLHWQPAPYATVYRIDESLDQNVWTELGATADTFFVFPSDTVLPAIRFYRATAIRE